MSKRPQDTSAEEPDGGNPHIRLRGGPRPDNRSGLLNKATWHGQVIAESDQTIELDGYHYFPPASVRMELLQSSPKTEADHRCPHSVQFFNLTDGSHRSERAAWAYEAPRASGILKVQ